MSETTWAVAKPYEVADAGSLVIVIPKAVREAHQVQRGTRYLVKTDERGRIIYEPVGGAK